MPWIDKLSNITYSDAQLDKRYDAIIQREFPLRKERAMNRKAFGQMKGTYTLTDKEQADEALYEQLVEDTKTEFEQAKLDNTLLKEVIVYEKAQQRLKRYILSEGREAVPEVPEIKDEETGEIIQEFVPEVKAIEPLPATIDLNTYDSESGELISVEQIPNPKIIQDVQEREEAQTIIDSASADVLNLIEERSSAS